MIRYYSHYAVLPPGLLLKNQVVELDAEGHLHGFYPLEGEISHTQFYSGLLVFCASGCVWNLDFIEMNWNVRRFDEIEKYLMLHSDEEASVDTDGKLNVLHFK